MTMHSADSGAPDGGDLQIAAAMFHSLSDPSRLAILQHLTLGEHRVRDLTEHLGLAQSTVGLAQSTVSAHLACLRECGLVVSRPQGRASVFSLVSAPELLAVLAAAERLLETTGQGVALCPNYGVGTTDNPAPETLRVHASVGALR